MDPVLVAGIVERISNPVTQTDIKQLLTRSASRNTIWHPMFLRRRWTLSDEDYVRLSPALMLAQNILESPQSYLFFATYLNAPRTRMTETNTDPLYPVGVPLERFARSRSGLSTAVFLSAAQRAQVWAVLIDLSEAVQFEVSWLVDQRGWEGMTIGDQVLSAGQPEMSSKISIKQEFLKGCDPWTDPNPWFLLSNWLLVSITLVHEIAHAFHIYHHGTQVPEPMFEDQGFYEIGNAFEIFLFQGNVAKTDYMQNHPLNQQLVRAGPNTFLGLDKPHHAQTWLEEGSCWAIKEEWLSAIFGAEFWSRTLSETAMFPEVYFYSRMTKNRIEECWVWQQ